MNDSKMIWFVLWVFAWLFVGVAIGLSLNSKSKAYKQKHLGGYQPKPRKTKGPIARPPRKL